MKLLLKPEGVDHARVPASRAADRRRTSSTPSTTSTSPTSRSSRSSSLAARHGLKVIDVEELADARRLAARLSRARRLRAPAVGRASASCSRARATVGFSRSQTYARFAEQVRRTKRKLLSLPDRGQGQGKTHLRLRRAGQGQHAAQLLRHRHRLPRLHGRPQSLQARPLHARACTSRSMPVEAIDAAKPDYILILPWNLKDEIVQPDAPRRRLGRQVHRSHPRSARSSIPAELAS